MWKNYKIRKSKLNHFCCQALQIKACITQELVKASVGRLVQGPYYSFFKLGVSEVPWEAESLSQVLKAAVMKPQNGGVADKAARKHMKASLPRSPSGAKVTLASALMGLRHSTQVLAQNLSKHFRQQWWPSFCTYFFPCKGSLQ